MRLRKVSVILLAAFLLLRDIPAFAYTLGPEYLCELGIKYYQQGKIGDAVSELKKALLADPDYEPARRYLSIINRQLALQQGAQLQMPVAQVSFEQKIADIYSNLERIYGTLDKIDRKISGVYTAEKPLVIQQVTQELKAPEMMEVLGKIAASLERLEQKMSAPAPAVKQEALTQTSPEMTASLERVIAALEKMDKKFALQEEVGSLKGRLEEQKGAAQVKTSEISSVLDNILKAIEKIEKRIALLEGFEEARQKAVKQPPAVASRPAEEVIVREKPAETAVIPKKGPAVIPEKEPLKAVVPRPEKKLVEAVSIPRKVVSAPVTAPRGGTVKRSAPAPAEGKPDLTKGAPPQIINLYENYNSLKFPLEIEQYKSIVIKGHTIARFLATESGIIDVVRSIGGSDEITVTAKGLGRTYFHVWDDKGRWTLEFQVVPPRTEGLTVAEQMRLQEERSGTFRLGYDMNWESIETGTRFGELDRQSYSWSHGFFLRGETPYGDFDSIANMRTTPLENEFTSYSMGIDKGRLWNFRDFAFRVFDVTPKVSNLAFGGNSIRGFTFNSPAFNKKLDYTVFRGKDRGGLYGSISPGLREDRDSFVEGIDINYYPKGKVSYGLAAFHGFGDERLAYLNDYAYYADINWNISKQFRTRYEIGYNTDKTALLLNGRFVVPKLNLMYEFRNINKDYLNITGDGWRNGEQGGLFSANYVPNDRWSFSNMLDIYRDRLYPARDDDDRLNQDYNFNARYRIDKKTNLAFDYVLQNDLGKLSQIRYQSAGMNLTRLFDLLSKEVSTYAHYRHSINTIYTAPAGNTVNDTFSAGLRLKLLGELYYYLNKQWQWMDECYYDRTRLLESLETGVDINSRIGNSPFYRNMRLIYRQEKTGGSTLGMVSGESYVEGYSEISYKPTIDTELYCSGRLRHIWPEDESQHTRADANFNAGLRYVWDTGLRWETKSSVEGYVFKDVNADGLRQRDEAPMGGIKVWAGKRSAVTDVFGYFSFSQLKGKKITVSLDVSTLPPGFVFTGPALQEVELAQSRKFRVDFGLISRSEISGVAFHDTNGDNGFSRGETGVKGVVVFLENGMKAVTDDSGRYVFSNVPSGEHTVSFDLNSLPVVYLPKVALSKKIELFEGVTYNYNIPLKKTR